MLINKKKINLLSNLEDESKLIKKNPLRIN
jgi:hypothetical protein